MLYKRIQLSRSSRILIYKSGLKMNWKHFRFKIIPGILII